MENKTEETKPQPALQKVVRKVKCEFTDPELQELGMKLAGHVANKRSHENEKKQVVAGYSAKIAEEVARIDDTQNKLSNGFEIRDQELQPVIDWTLKRKNYIDDEGNVKDWENLTAADYQWQLKIDNVAAGKNEDGSDPNEETETEGDENEYDLDRVDEDDLHKSLDSMSEETTKKKRNSKKDPADTE